MPNLRPLGLRGYKRSDMTNENENFMKMHCDNFPLEFQLLGAPPRVLFEALIY